MTQDFPLEPRIPPSDRNAEPGDPRSDKGHATNWVAEARLQYLPLGVDVECWNRHAFSALVKTTWRSRAAAAARLLLNFGM